MTRLGTAITAPPSNRSTAMSVYSLGRQAEKGRSSSGVPKANPSSYRNTCSCRFSSASRAASWRNRFSGTSSRIPARMTAITATPKARQSVMPSAKKPMRQ